MHGVAPVPSVEKGVVYLYKLGNKDRRRAINHAPSIYYVEDLFPCGHLLNFSHYTARTSMSKQYSEQSTHETTFDSPLNSFKDPSLSHCNYRDNTQFIPINGLPPTHSKAPPSNMAAPNGDVPKTEATPKSESTNDSGPKEPSKRALDKARKKAEKAAKKAEYALRPKETSTETKSKSLFEEGWLKRTFEEKPVPPGAIQTRFPPEPNVFLLKPYCPRLSC